MIYAMKIQRVSIDTSVFGGCFDQEFAPWSQALMNDVRRYRLLPSISDVVAAEIADAPEPVQLLYAEIAPFASAIIGVSPEAIALADIYQQRHILTPKFYDDGLHSALATIAEVDVLVSWNFKHIVHYQKIRLFNAVNLEAGYKPLVIYSPREVATYDESDD